MTQHINASQALLQDDVTDDVTNEWLINTRSREPANARSHVRSLIKIRCFALEAGSLEFKL